MLNREHLSQVNYTQLIVIAWVFFTSVYFFLSVGYPFVIGKTQQVAIATAQQQGYNTAVSQAMQTFSGNVFQNGYGKAVLDLATALDAQVQGGCKEAVPVTIGTGSIGIISTVCIHQAAQASATPPAGPEIAPAK